MPDKIEMTKSDFGGILGGVLDPCSSLLPGEEPIPGMVPPDPEGCQHWMDTLGLRGRPMSSSAARWVTSGGARTSETVHPTPYWRAMLLSSSDLSMTCAMSLRSGRSHGHPHDAGWTPVASPPCSF
jgi:hypothetical protein